MRCEEAANDIAEYLRGTLSSDSGLAEHLSSCVRCRQEIEELQKVWTELDQIAVPRSSPVMHDNLLRALAEAKLEPVHPTTKIPRRLPMPFLMKSILLIVLSAGAALFVGHREVRDNDAHYRGASDAPVTLLQYGDYDCPPCVTYNPIVNELLSRYGDKLRLEFRHFPLREIHPNAFGAALAAEAAGELGRYWEMHDLLLSFRQQWSRAADPEQEFAKLAASIGLDPNRFNEAFAKPELRQRVMDDITKGQQAGIQAVPAFFINGRRIEKMIGTSPELC